MIHDLKCQVTGAVLGTIELPDDMPADEVLRRTYTESGFVADGVPVPMPVPESITPASLRIALRRLHGITSLQLHDAVEACISKLPSLEEQDDAHDLWQYATKIERSHQLVASVAQQLGLTDAQVDEVFRASATI